MKSKNSLCMIAFLMVSLVYGCAELYTPPNGEDGLGSASVSATVAGLSADEVTAIQITVSGPNISPDIVADLTQDPGTGDWSGVIENIPAGANRTFLAEASNGGAEVVYSGSATGVTITDGQQAVVNLFLQQTAPPDPFVNTVPIFDSLVLSSAQVAPGNEVTLTVAVSDPDPGDVLTLLWTPTGGSFDATNTASVVWTAPATEGLYSLTVAASDNTGATSTLTVTIDVQTFYGSGSASVEVDINTWPEVQNLVPTPTRVDEGESTLLNLTASDPDGDPLTYAWSADCTGTFSDASVEDPSFTLDADNAGVPCSLTVALDDGRGGSNSASVAIATGPPVSSSAPAAFSFEPILSFVTNGLPPGPSYPDPLTVRLNEPAEVETLVTVTSTDPAALLANDVTIPTGSATGVVLLEGQGGSASEPIAVTATLDGSEMTAYVRALGAAGNEIPALFALAPEQADAAPGGTVELSVVVDAPAPAGGTVVDLTYSGGGSGPASVTIPPSENIESFLFTAGAAGTSSTITAVLGADQRSATVTVLDPALVAGDIIVTEIHYDPSGTPEQDEEWFEVYNTSDVPVNMRTWVIRDEPGALQESTVVLDDLTVPPLGFAVLCANADAGTNGGVLCDYEYGSFVLANTDDEVVLDLDGLVVDEVRYNELEGWPVASGRSLMLDPAFFDYLSNDSALNWCATPAGYDLPSGDRGTPGAPNPSCQ